MISRLLAQKHALRGLRPYLPRFLASTRTIITRVPSGTIQTKFASSSQLLAQGPAYSSLATPESGSTYKITDLELNKYHEIANDTMDRLQESLEELLENEPDAEGWDIDYSSGVLTLKTDHGTWVINKQPPNKQIWLSSPSSGPKRYDYSDVNGGTWFYYRDGTTLKELLEEELRKIVDGEVTIKL